MENIGTVLAALIPSALFITLILYYTVFKGGASAPKVVKTEHSLKIIGISTKTTDASLAEDDTLLWNEFKRVREKSSMPKPKSYVLIKMMPKEGETSWEYLVGIMVPNFDNVPAGFKTLEVPHQTYAMVRYSFKREVAWLATTMKIEDTLYKKWLPSSDYEPNTSSPIRSIEYHNKKEETNQRIIIFYASVKKKKSLRPDFGG
jgi:predicted transcriptional regulator YdeE